MPNRKNRLKKGIESIEKQMKLHEQKIKKAKEQGNIELEGYYEKEIRHLKETIEKKKNFLNK